MGLIRDLLGIPDVGGTVKDVADGVGGLATSIRSAITGELPPKIRGEIEKVATDAEALAMKTQGEVTKLEAQSKSLFIAGWRPAIGWICVSGLGLHFIIFPILKWITDVDPPPIEVGALMSLVAALLGLGGLRTYEKKEKITK